MGVTSRTGLTLQSSCSNIPTVIDKEYAEIITVITVVMYTAIMGSSEQSPMAITNWPLAAT